MSADVDLGGRWTVHPVGALNVLRAHLHGTPSHRMGILRRTLWNHVHPTLQRH